MTHFWRWLVAAEAAETAHLSKQTRKEGKWISLLHIVGSFGWFWRRRAVTVSFRDLFFNEVAVLHSMKCKLCHFVIIHCSRVHDLFIQIVLRE